MSVVKRLVCLANSRKLSGRCIAGKEIAGKRVAGWVRPVSARPHEEVSEYERQYEDGSDPRVMEIIDVPLLDPRPNGYQQENWLLDPKHYWVKADRIKWDTLERLADPGEPLWMNGNSTYHGSNDRIPLPAAGTLNSSLRLVRVESLTLSVFAPGEAFGNTKRRIQGRFRHDQTEYRLWVTDPGYERAYLAKSDGEYSLGEGFLTVSLGEPADDNYCYKLVAAIIEREKEL
jgi:hypothetical protein